MIKIDILHDVTISSVNHLKWFTVRYIESLYERFKWTQNTKKGEIVMNVDFLNCYPDVLTTKDIMRIFQMSRSRCFRFVKSGIVPFFKLDDNGRTLYVLKSELVKYLENKQ